VCEPLVRNATQVAASKAAWAALGAAERLALLKKVRDRLVELTPQWVEAGACRCARVQPRSHPARPPAAPRKGCHSHGYLSKDPQHAHLVAEIYVRLARGAPGEMLTEVVAPNR
jgi:hypothetical protein